MEPLTETNMLYLLERIAHALEALARAANANFQTLAEVLKAKADGRNV